MSVQTLCNPVYKSTNVQQKFPSQLPTKKPLIRVFETTQNCEKNPALAEPIIDRLFIERSRSLIDRTIKNHNKNSVKFGTHIIVKLTAK